MSGTPVVRPLWMEFPSDEGTFGTDEAFMVGNSILVQGIYTEVISQYLNLHSETLGILFVIVFWIIFSQNLVCSKLNASYYQAGC